MDTNSINSRITKGQIQLALSEHRLFKNGEPQWHNLATAKSARKERRRRIRLFKKYGDLSLKERLDSCRPHNRCASGACPVCGRAFQRFVVNRTKRLLSNNGEYKLLSIIPNAPVIPGQLHAFCLNSLIFSLSQSLKKCGINFAIGGVDFSYNEDQRSEIQCHWSPHFWLLAKSPETKNWKAVLRTCYPKSDLSPVPVKIKPWDQDVSAIGYALKTGFDRRITKDGRRFRNGISRECRVTQHDRIRSKDRLELYSYLDYIGLESRLILTGVNVTLFPHLQLLKKTD